MITDFGHWVAPFKEIDIESYFGFIYRITNLENNMMYIGRKQFNMVTSKKIAGRINKKKIVKESNWRTYTSSSNTINQLICECTKDIFKFEIIELCKTKAELVYREVEIQWEEKVLSATLPSGERKYYNGNIGAIKFRLDRHKNQTKQTMAESAKGNQNASGAVRAESTRKKMGDAKRGVPKSADHKQKLRDVNLHKEASSETKEKIGASHRGKETSPETKQRMSDSAKGRNYIPAIKCVIDDIEYDTLASAADAHGITRGVLKRRILSPKYSNYRYTA